MNLWNVVGETGVDLSFVRSYLKNGRISLISSPSSVEVGGECLSKDIELEKRICSELEFIINDHLSWAWKNYINRKNDIAYLYRFHFP